MIEKILHFIEATQMTVLNPNNTYEYIPVVPRDALDAFLRDLFETENRIKTDCFEYTRESIYEYIIPYCARRPNFIGYPCENCEYYAHRLG